MCAFLGSHSSISFVVLDMHTVVWPSKNTAFWCAAAKDGTGNCKTYCRNIANGWANKCKYNADCNGCDDCAPVCVDSDGNGRSV